jgi:hypothetical protein
MTTWTRRQFVRATAAAGAAAAMSPRGVLGANDRIGVALLCCGGRGSQLWPHFLAQTSRAWWRRRVRAFRNRAPRGWEAVPKEDSGASSIGRTSTP